MCGQYGEVKPPQPFTPFSDTRLRAVILNRERLAKREAMKENHHDRAQPKDR